MPHRVLEGGSSPRALDDRQEDRPDRIRVYLLPKNIFDDGVGGHMR
jgi:hypothetical protein